MGPVVVVLMGVSGSGKTTVGRALGQRLRWDFFDADDFHSATSVAKMRRGIPLDDADRIPWLDTIHRLLWVRVETADPAVVACSALRRGYRDRLRAGLDAGSVLFAYLEVDRETLVPRLRHRAGHYMPVSLLDTQLAALEPPSTTPGDPDEALVIDAHGPVAAAVDTIAGRAIVSS
jgi:gluconokinase